MTNGITIYKNVEGTSTTDLIVLGNEDFQFTKFELENMMITNASSTSITVDLFVYHYRTNDRNAYPPIGGGEVIKESSTLYRYYLLKAVTLPVGTSISLNAEELVYDVNQFNLGMSLDDTASKADVKITTRQITSSTKYRYNSQRQDFGYSIAPVQRT